MQQRLVIECRTDDGFIKKNKHVPQILKNSRFVAHVLKENVCDAHEGLNLLMLDDAIPAGAKLY